MWRHDLACSRSWRACVRLKHLWSPTGRARGTSTFPPLGATSYPPTGCSTTWPPTANLSRATSREGRGAMAGLKNLLTKQ